MKKSKLQVIQTISLILGICLIVIAAVMLIVWNRNIGSSQKEVASYVSILRDVMPSPQDAIPEERRDNTMSVLSVEGRDFVGILEMPGYGSEFPIGGDWGDTTQYPCRFYGSIYDGTLRIGATSQKGQYDFYNEISLGDAVIFTDMEGNRYNLQVTGVRSAESADQTTLNREEAPLVLFIEKIYSLEYLIIYCDMQN